MWTVLALYTVFVSTVSAFHEAWKDETQAWRWRSTATGCGSSCGMRYEVTRSCST